MKNIIYKSKCILSVALCLTMIISFNQVNGQNTKIIEHGNCNIIGVWQRNDSIIGNGIGQNIIFQNDGTFTINLGTISDDARMLIKLEGKYRVVNSDEIYFTIISRTLLDGGEIVLSDGGIDLNLFNIVNAKIIKYVEKKPHEIKYPCFIDFISCEKLKINNEIYFRVGVSPNPRSGARARP